MQGDFHLGRWLVCPKLNTVQADGRVIRLEPKFMQVLVCLANRPGEVISKEELLRAVWLDTFVTDDVLTRAISELRRVLGDDAKRPHVIETVARTGYRIIAPVLRREEGALHRELKSKERLLTGLRTLLVAGVAAAAVAIVISVALRRRPVEVQMNRLQPIAVLPLQNTSASKNFDFLRIGLADDVANTLSYYPTLSMRPFAITNQYAGAGIDLQRAAREMRVADLITGHFVVAGEEIEVTLEAVDATSDRVLWRDTVRGTVHDLMGIHQQIATRLQHGLVEALGLNAGPGASSNTSPNAEAYELYLRAVSEGNSTKSQIENAIRLLQRAVAVDPSYSSAWAHLGHLYYYGSGFGDVNKSSRLRAKAALQRAVALDSGRIDAASDLITMESEEGELYRAYDDITELLHRRPDSAAVHLVYSYVLWYGGLLNDAASECEKARSLDAGTTDLPSCGNIFMALGRYERAKEYLQLYSGSEYERSVKAEIFLREGKQAEALQELKSLPATVENSRQMLEPCLQNRAPTKAEAAAAQELHSGVMAVDDPLPKYYLAAWDSLCDQPDLAFRELRRAIEQSYCAYPQMETDPLLEKLRIMPQFAEIQSLGITCQQHFLKHKKQGD
jgi:DNA-binding winged helix-turn-helix (wHTH) protein/TolB-like protein/Tfp pilus assembly protein PilF